MLFCLLKKYYGGNNFNPFEKRTIYRTRDAIVATTNSSLQKNETICASCEDISIVFRSALH